MSPRKKTSSTDANACTAPDQTPKQVNYKRVQLHISNPEAWAKFESFAHATGTNPNAILNKFVEVTVTQYADKITEYERMRDTLRNLSGMGDPDRDRPTAQEQKSPSEVSEK